jgi:DNA-binding transcriptional ArsR family regulator
MVIMAGQNNAISKGQSDISECPELACPGEGERELPILDERTVSESAKIFKALSDETRLKILAYLQDGELCVCDIIEALGKPQSTVSHHLFLLQTAGLIKSRKQGRWILYSSEEEVLERYNVAADIKRFSISKAGQGKQTASRGAGTTKLD